MNSRTSTPATRMTRPTATRMVENDTRRCYRPGAAPGRSPATPRCRPLRYDRAGPSVAPAGPGESPVPARARSTSDTVSEPTGGRRTRRMRHRRGGRASWWPGPLWSAVGVWSAYRHDQRGLAALQTVRDTSDPTTLTASSTEATLHGAAAEFAAAHDDLTGPWMAPATWLPVLGRQLRSVRSLSSAAQQVSSVGATFLGQVHDVLDQPHGAGPERVAVAATPVGPVAVRRPPARRRRHRSGRGAGRARWPASTTSSCPSSTTPAAGWPRRPRCPSVMATILQGPQTYLVLAANNAEMRAGSGAFLEVGTADVRRRHRPPGRPRPVGRPRTPRARSSSPATSSATGDGWSPGSTGGPSGVTPQFPVTADLASRMWAARTGQHVEGCWPSTWPACARS